MSLNPTTLPNRSILPGCFPDAFCTSETQHDTGICLRLETTIRNLRGEQQVAKAKKTFEEATVKVDERINDDRREQDDQRDSEVPVDAERRTGGRRKVQRRRQIDPTTCERDYTGDEIQFMHAMDEYKRASGRMFPTCSEILEVVRALGYEQTKTPVVAYTPAAGEFTGTTETISLLESDEELDEFAS